MFDKICDVIFFKCEKCGYSLNPYAHNKQMCLSVEEAFHYSQHNTACPGCNKYGIWIFNN